MRSKRPFRSLIVCVSCAMVGCILASTAYSRRVDELEIERDIYASRFQNWQTRAMRNARIICKTFRHSGTRQKKTCWH